MAFAPTGPVADFATLRAAMFDDGAVPVGGAAQTRVQWPGAPGKMGFEQNGLLFIPNRGVLRVLPGDWVGVDNRGWPILLSADTIANGLWSHS
jgi:hypothetical protein